DGRCERRTCSRSFLSCCGQIAYYYNICKTFGDVMKASELREKSVEELNGVLLAQLKEQFKLRMQAATGQLGQTHLLAKARKDIARVKTALDRKSTRL